MLRRAFGPLDGAGEPVDPDEAWRLAESFDLVSRIAGRLGPEALARDLGEGSSGKWLDAYRLTAASGLQFLAFARRMAGAANGLGIPLAFLKGTALGLAGVVPLGWRGACDVDLLVPPGRLEELRAALSRDGFVSSPLPGCEHQMPPLYHTSGLMVELHRFIPGLRLGSGRKSATFEDLERRGLLERGSEAREGSFIPARSVLVAHCLVHGLVQHGLAPRTYPPFRVVADLIDLGFGGSESALPVGFRLDGVDDETEAAARELCRHLVRGVTPDLVAGDSTPSRLLRHFVAGATDERYAEALRARALFFAGPSEKSAPLAFLSAVRHALFISRPEVDAIYGPQKAASGYVFRQVMRPLDIVARAMRYSIQAVRSGLARPGTHS